MKASSLRKLILPPGPVLSLTLIGFLLSGAVLYYRAVKSQRFLEPVLAVLQPRIEFAKDIRTLLHAEFGEKQPEGVMFTTNSILVRSPILGDPARSEEIIGKLGRLFLAMMEDPKMRGYIDLIIIRTNPPLLADRKAYEKIKAQTEHAAHEILRSLYRAEPVLGKDYPDYFTAAAIPVLDESKAGWVEFRILASEQMHIDLLMKLEKYVR